jgi:hypothetical protein
MVRPARRTFAVRVSDPGVAAMLRLALVALAALGFASRLTAAERPNIVFIFSDDAGY